MDFRGRRQQCGNAVSERNFRQGCRFGAARSAALHEKHANLGYASLTSCLKSPRRGQRPSICEELVLGNSTLKNRPGQTQNFTEATTRIALFRLTYRRSLSTILDFREKGVASVVSRMTMHQPILEGGRGVGGWRAAGLRLAGRLAGDKLAASGERANSGRRQPGRRKAVERGRLERGRPRPTPDTERTTERPIPPYAMV